jgi:two-component system nitrate/nitrite response regulator NarL
MALVKLLIVDDHEFFLASILPPLQREAAIEIVGTALSGPTALDLAEALHPDVILMDLNMPHLSALGVLARLAPRSDRPAVLILTGADDAPSVRGAFAAGVQGYLRKDQITDELLLSAIFAVANGGVFMDARTFALLLSLCP